MQERFCVRSGSVLDQSERMRATKDEAYKGWREYLKELIGDVG